MYPKILRRVLFVFGLLLLLRPVGGLFTTAHLHAPGWDGSFFITQEMAEKEFLAKTPAMEELAKRNEEFRQEYDLQYDRSERKLSIVLGYVHRSDILLLIAGLLMMLASVAMRKMEVSLEQR